MHPWKEGQLTHLRSRHTIERGEGGFLVFGTGGTDVTAKNSGVELRILRWRGRKPFS